MRLAKSLGFVFLLCLLMVLSSPVFAQHIQLRHNFSPGQSANAVTKVQMSGDSLLTGQKAATQLQMQMSRGLLIGGIDSFGNANMDVSVQRIRTQGKMENASFNKDLTGSELNSVMFGATQMEMQVSPLGHVQAQDSLGLQKLGITLPGSVGDTGGFEFPTFPVEPVRIGDSWTENGQLLRGQDLRNNNVSGDGVYKLYRIYSSPQGRIGVIRYKKVTDLSGLGLGGNNLSGSQGTKVGGLVIQLDGEIEFNIDQGIVVKTTQQGYWNLDMNLNMGSSNLAGLAGGNSVRPRTVKSPQQTGLKQNMKIKIGTQFQWTGVQKPKQNQQSQQTHDPIKIQMPFIFNPPNMPELPKVETEVKEIP